jgi:osmoprotectant transport system substrate-binding protein
MRRSRPAWLTIAAVLVAGCGGGSDKAAAPNRTSTLPGAGKPVIRLATKNFTEAFVLGELYAQALRAKGFRVVIKHNVGGSELADKALLAGAIDLYPDYIGVIASELARSRARPRTAQDTYRRAKAFEATRDVAILARSPGSDVDATAVKPAFARRHGLTSTTDLRKLGRFRYGGPAENLARFQGAIGLREVYGLRRMQYVSLSIPARYAALDDGRVDAVAVFTTEGQLADRSRYTVLTDPKGIFGFQNIVPVVKQSVLRQQGPAFARTLDAVTATLTDRALQGMNAAVDLRKQQPADVARRFLGKGGLQ